MNKTSVALALVCIVLLLLTCWFGYSSFISTCYPETAQFVDLDSEDDLANIESLSDFSDGTVVFAFHDSQAGVDDEKLKEFLAEKSLESTKVVKIDVNSQQSLAQRYNVNSTPELFVMQNGQVVSRDNRSCEPAPTKFNRASHQRKSTQSRDYVPYGRKAMPNRRGMR